jgi:Na+-translocating ferredoxin:NAD+ oxidoreductase subunit B
MYEFQVGRLTKDFYEDSEEYFAGEFHKEFFSSVPQMRVVPVEKSISVENCVATYDEMRKIVNNTEGQFGLIDCLCKQGKDLFGHKCQTTNLRETCIMFPAITASLVRLGAPFHAVSKDEILKLLQQAEHDGLVIQPSNTQEPLIVCNCCGDCCAPLRMAKMFPKPAALFATNFHAEVDNELCSGCGVCLKRCQMEALTVVKKKSSINLDRCIGCGLCVSTCPKKAIKLVKKDKTIVPPKTNDDLQIKILSKKVGKAKLLKIGLKKVAGQKI